MKRDIRKALVSNSKSIVILSDRLGYKSHAEESL